MAAIVWADVTAFAAELSAVPSAAQTDILNWVNYTLRVDYLDGESGYSTRLTRIYLAAHHGAVALTSAGGAGGPVQAESAGGVSVAYGIPTDAEAATTAGGREYKAMVRRYCGGPWVF